jgi:hypothetical protein
MNAKVFITQIPNKRVGDQYVPSVNIGPAAEHGELLEPMMPPQAAFYATADLVKQIKEHLKDYNYEAGDSILGLGDPTIMAVAFAVLGSIKGRFRVLKWDRDIKRYTITSVTV